MYEYDCMLPRAGVASELTGKSKNLGAHTGDLTLFWKIQQRIHLQLLWLYILLAIFIPARVAYRYKQWPLSTVCVNE